MEYDMEQYINATVAKYVKLAEEVTGKPVKIKKVMTPFLPEDHKESPAGKPCGDGPALQCPWCRHTFPENEVKHVILPGVPTGEHYTGKPKKPKAQSYVPKTKDWEPPGSMPETKPGSANLTIKFCCSQVITSQV